MKAMIVFAQVGEQSFNHEILQRVTATCEKIGVTYTVRDLYKMKFQPVFSAEDMQKVEQNEISSDIEEEQQVITEADTLVMIYPVWWWSQPAILKGWIDRVFTNNFAFHYEKNGPVGRLRNKKAIVFTTTRESEQEMRQSGMDQVLHKQIDQGILAFSGFSPVTYRNFAGVPSLNDAARKQILEQVEKTITSIKGEPVLM